MIKEGNKSKNRGVYFLDKEEYEEIISRNEDQKQQIIEEIKNEQEGKTVRWSDKWKQELI